jgi:hypothetical protein
VGFVAAWSVVEAKAMTITYDTASVALDRIPVATGRDDEFRASRSRVRLLRIPPHRFVMMDGVGTPNGRAFEPRMAGLYGTAYPLRFALKRRGVIGKVGPLEGLWWSTDAAWNLDALLADDRSSWRWTLMIALPDEATEDEIQEHIAIARTKLEPQLAASLRAAPFEEGAVAQLMHIGPYAAERPSIEKLHEQIAEAGLRPRGRHHEIYLGDPRRSAPAKLRTVLRQPVE